MELFQQKCRRFPVLGSLHRILGNNGKYIYNDLHILPLFAKYPETSTETSTFPKAFTLRLKGFEYHDEMMIQWDIM